MRIGTRSFDTAQDRLPTAGNSKQIAVFGYALSLMLFASSVPAAAQQSGKVHRIGFLMSSSTAETTAFIEAFRQGMRELGYLDGKNFVLEIRGGGANLDRLTNLAAELVRLEVDVIVAGGGSATRAAKKATNTIPVVIRTGADPVKAGLVDSLARPGGNITGLASINDELSGKRLEVLLELVPRIKRVAILAGRDRDRFLTTTESEQIAAAARALGVNLQVLQALDPNSIDNAFLAMSKARAEGLVVIPITSYFQHRKLIIEQAAKNRLAAIYPHSIWVENGGLISYGADFRDENRHLAIYVDKILKGAKPADLPVEQPTKFELVINLKAAKQIGLTIPPHVLARAEKVIR